MKGIGKVRAQQGAEPFQDVDREGKEGLVPGSTGRVKENGDLPLLRTPGGHLALSQRTVILGSLGSDLLLR